MTEAEGEVKITITDNQGTVFVIHELNRADANSLRKSLDNIYTYRNLTDDAESFIDDLLTATRNGNLFDS